MIETLFAEIAERGWLVSNLFQLDSGLWQANLRNSSHHTDFGRGLTPVLALSAAIDAIETAEENAPDIGYITHKEGLPRELEKFRTIDLARILTNLRKPGPKIEFKGLKL